MKQEIIELLATDDVAIKYREIESWKDCKKCNNGIIMETGEVCECSLDTLLSLILDIPKRYDISFKLNTSVEKQLKADKKFIILLGENKYVKLVGYGIAKEKIKQGKMVKYIDTKQTITPQDISSLIKSDVILFEDLFKQRSDFSYKSYLTKRIDYNKEIIFLGKTDIIECDEDFLEIEVDSSDVKIK